MATGLVAELAKLLPVMQQVYAMTEKRQIKGVAVANDEKIFSIYEQHTDIIVKGGRKVQFGHKINISTGKSNLVLSCDILRGNPSDTALYRPTLENIISNYETIPRDSVTDGRVRL